LHSSANYSYDMTVSMWSNYTAVGDSLETRDTNVPSTMLLFVNNN